MTPAFSDSFQIKRRCVFLPRGGTLLHKPFQPERLRMCQHYFIFIAADPPSQLREPLQITAWGVLAHQADKHFPRQESPRDPVEHCCRILYPLWQHKMPDHHPFPKQAGRIRHISDQAGRYPPVPPSRAGLPPAHSRPSSRPPAPAAWQAVMRPAPTGGNGSGSPD